MNNNSDNNLIKGEIESKNIKNNNYGISDTICRIIIDKIISKAITQANNNLVYSKINNHCFEFLINCVDIFLSTDFIFYENDQYDNYNSEEYFSSSMHENINDMQLLQIEEPQTPEIDRYHSIKTKIVKSPDIDSNKNILEIDLNKISSKDNNEISLLSRNNRSEKKLNTLKEATEFEYQLYSNSNSNTNTDKIEEEKENNINEKVNKKKIIKNDKKNDSKKENVKKNDKHFIIDLPCYDLPKEAYENKYISMNSNKENNFLRLEREKENINKEQQKILEKIQQKKEYEKRFKIKFIKEFDSNKITFDPNGNIINLNIPNIDSFSNEFYIPEPIIADLKYKNNIPYTKNNEIPKKILSIKKNKSTEQKYSINNFNTLEKIDINNNNYNLDNNIKNEKDKKFKKNNMISKFKILNPSYSLNSLLNPKNKGKLKIEYNPILEEEQKKSPRIKLPPSGSNFDKIIPEVGVVIQSDNKNEIKKGGFEYYNKYNKPSINEYSQLVRETLKLNHQLKLSSLTSGNLNQNKKDINKNFNTEQSDYNGYNQEFIDNNNPLIQNALEPISNSKSKIEYNNSTNHKSLIKNKSQIEVSHSSFKGFFKSFDNKHNKIKNTKSKLFNAIKINKQNFIPNLYSFLSNTDNKEDTQENSNKNVFKALNKRSLSNFDDISKEIINNDNYYSLSPLKRRIQSQKKINVLPYINNEKKYKNKKLELIGEDFINNFNSKIIKNKNWGDDYTRKTIKVESELKNIFRKPLKINRLKNQKEIIGTRKRVPHIINTNSQEKKELIFI